MTKFSKNEPVNEHKVPTIAIVGRPNVGKSSIFNVIIGRRMAIVHEQSGVTRDRIVAPVIWHSKHFQVIDTGGLGRYNQESKHVDMWDRGIRQQVDIAIEGADIIFFVVNVQDGLVALDEEVADKLRSCEKDVYLLVNKCDNAKLEGQAVSFSALAFENIYTVSCMHRTGFDDLLDDALEEIPTTEDDETAQPFKMTVIGRPNVGKSSLINELLGEDRVMVSDVAGTTRDSVDMDFELEYKGEQLPAKLIDTAGLRKKSKVDDLVEVFSVMRAESAIKRADLVLFVVEAKPEGLTAQDRRIARIISEEGKACVIVANKWDTCEGHKQKHVLDEIRYTLPRMNYAPVVFVSALNGYNVTGMLDDVAEVMEQLEVHIPTSMLNSVVEDAVMYNSPPVIGKHPFKIYYGTMVGNNPPHFVLFVNNPKLCADNFLGYLNNYMRKCFGLNGLPIKISLRARPKKEFVDTDRKRTPFRAKKVKPSPKSKKSGPKSTTGKKSKSAPKAKRNALPESYKKKAKMDKENKPRAPGRRKKTRNIRRSR